MTDNHLTPRSPDQPPAEQSTYPAAEYAAEPAWPEMDGDEGGFDWRSELAALLRYKWVILLASLLGAGGAYVAWTQVEPEYVAEGSLWVQGDEDNRGPIVTDGLFQVGAWLDLIGSYSVLDTVVAQQKLYVRPAAPNDLPLFEDFELGEQVVPGSYFLRVAEGGAEISLHTEGGEVDRGAPGDVLGTDRGFHWTTPRQGLPAGREVAFSVATPRAAADRLRDELVTQIDGQGTFIGVSLTSKERERGANVVNAVMTRHVALAAELKSGHLAEQAEILERQLLQQEEELRIAERTLEEFRINTITLPGEDSRAIQPGLEMTRGPVFDEFFSMRVEQEQIQRDRERLEQAMASMEANGFQLQTIEMIPAIRESSEIQEALGILATARSEYRAMMEVFTPQHPPAVELAQRIESLETDRLPSLIRGLIAEMRNSENALDQRIASSAGEMRQIPRRAMEEARMMGSVAIARELYTELRRRYETANLARASSIPEIRILDYATPPESPLDDERVRLAGMIFMGFVGLGVLVAIVLGRVDSRIRSPSEIQKALGLNVLGAIPRIQQGKGKREGGNVAQVYEAFRELRTNLSYAYGAAGPLVVAISSPNENEGKTLVSTNVGISFAGLGRRTLVIDADTRRGDLHHYLGGHRKPGLTDYLRSKVTSRELIQETPYDNLHFIGSGTQVSNSPELIASPRMELLIAALRTNFDVIILDCPPLAAGSDAVVMASLAGHMMVVIRSGSTEREFTQAKLEPLFRLPIRLLGVALNDYEPAVLSRDYQRYYGSYLAGYEAGAEDDTEGGRALGGPGAKTVALLGKKG